MATAISERLRTLTDDWARELRRSPLFKLIASAHLPPRALAFYLESMRQLIYYSERNLAVAGTRCRELEQLGLVDYFERKSIEENGHDRWSEADLARLPHAATNALRPAAAIQALLELQQRAIATHPICFAAYVVWAEYMTAILGDESVAMLVACGYERSQLTTLTKHTEADREHSLRGFEELAGLWRQQVDAEQVVETVRTACALFGGFCQEIWEQATMTDGVDPIVPEQPVPSVARS